MGTFMLTQKRCVLHDGSALHQRRSPPEKAGRCWLADLHERETGVVVGLCKRRVLLWRPPPSPFLTARSSVALPCSLNEWNTHTHRFKKIPNSSSTNTKTHKLRNKLVDKTYPVLLFLTGHHPSAASFWGLQAVWVCSRSPALLFPCVEQKTEVNSMLLSHHTSLKICKQLTRCKKTTSRQVKISWI